MLPSVRQLFYDDNFIYQYDNCPVHTANTITQWLGRNNIETLPHPARSPDLNPLENIWGFMVKAVSKSNARSRTQEELWETVKNTWEDLAQNEKLTQSLILSMARRLEEVIAKNGQMTKC
jgi:transposase